jgi:hypothetical protein
VSRGFFLGETWVNAKKVVLAVVVAWEARWVAAAEVVVKAAVAAGRTTVAHAVAVDAASTKTKAIAHRTAKPKLPLTTVNQA